MAWPSCLQEQAQVLWPRRLTADVLRAACKTDVVRTAVAAAKPAFASVTVAIVLAARRASSRRASPASPAALAVRRTRFHRARTNRARANRANLAALAARATARTASAQCRASWIESGQSRVAERNPAFFMPGDLKEKARNFPKASWFTSPSSASTFRMSSGFVDCESLSDDRSDRNHAEQIATRKKSNKQEKQHGPKKGRSQEGFSKWD